MCAMMYRQRPSAIALRAATVTLLGGAAVAYGLYRQGETAAEAERSVLITGCLTVMLCGVFLIIAFARYRFTHLWRKPAPASPPRRQAARHPRPGRR